MSRPEESYVGNQSRRVERGSVPRLARRIGVGLLTFYGVGVMVGAGIYVLIGTIAGIAGPLWRRQVGPRHAFGRVYPVGSLCAAKTAAYDGAVDRRGNVFAVPLCLAASAGDLARLRRFARA